MTALAKFFEIFGDMSSSSPEERQVERPPPESPAMRMIRKQAKSQGMTVPEFMRYYQSPEYTSEYDQPAVRSMVQQPGAPMQGQQPQTNQAELEARWQKMLADRPINKQRQPIIDALHRITRQR